MPMHIERDTYHSLDAVYDDLRARQLWPGISVQHGFKDVEPHWHTQGNRIYVMRGEATFTDVDANQSYDLKAGDMAEIPPRTVHTIDAPDPVVFIVGWTEPTHISDFIPHPPEDLHEEMT